MKTNKEGWKGPRGHSCQVKGISGISGDALGKQGPNGWVWPVANQSP